MNLATLSGDDHRQHARETLYAKLPLQQRGYALAKLMFGCMPGEHLPPGLAEITVSLAEKARRALHALVKQERGYEIGDIVEEPGGRRKMIVEAFFIPNGHRFLAVSLRTLKKDGKPSKSTTWHSIDARLTVLGRLEDRT